MYQKIKEYFEVHKQEMLDDIMAVIRIPSVNGPEKPGMPFGEENAKVLAFAASLAKELGLKAEVLENKVAVIDLNEQSAELDILAHLDVVPAGDGWTVTEPFVPVIRDGRLYGRGSSDDKGPAIAALYAMKAVKDLGITLTKNARLILGADEETASCIYTQKENKKIRKPLAADQTAFIFARLAAARLFSINSIRRLCWS